MELFGSVSLEVEFNLEENNLERKQVMSLKRNNMKEKKVVRRSGVARKIVHRSSKTDFDNSTRVDRSSFQVERVSRLRGIGEVFIDKINKGARFFCVAFNVMNEKPQNKES